MKSRLTNWILCLCLALTAILLIPQEAMAVSASLSGNNSVKAGDSVTLTLSVSGNIYGLSGTLSTGSGLTFTNYDCADAGMTLTVNGNNFAAYGTSATTGRIITVTLKVDSSLAAGTQLNAAFKNITVSDGETDANLGTASWSGTVGAKPSSECHLTDIRCSNATLSPAFSKDTTYYTANVPFSVSKLSLDYDRADKQGSSVSISDTTLAVGANTITLKVTAADGTTKIYTLSVTRQQDPNYKPGKDASLKELTLDVAAISPAFRSDCTEYVAYVPFETKEATLSGVAKDDKAVTSGEKTVKITKDGANDVAVVCTAEDGTTTQTYTVHVFRMPAFAGVLPTVEVIEEPIAEEAAAEETIEPAVTSIEIPAVLTLPLVGEAATVWVVGITAIVVLILLFVLGFLIGRGRAEDQEEGEADFGEKKTDTVPIPIVEQLWREKQLKEAEKSAEKTPGQYPVELISEEPPATAVEAESQQDEEAIPAEPTEKEEKPDGKAEDAIRAAEKEAESMSLEEILIDIRDM